MGKIKVKRKSTLIDMTAMSDVTVLLLTFFMLTSTFLQKEPTQVIVPPSVSEEKVVTENVAQILIAPVLNDDKQVVDHRVFINVTGLADISDDDKENWGSEAVRRDLAKSVVATYNELTGKNIVLDDVQLDNFAKLSNFGVPIDKLPEFLSLSQSEQDAWLSDMEPNTGARPNGIPTAPVIKRGDKMISEFELWTTHLVLEGTHANDSIRARVRRGAGLTVKTDHNIPYKHVSPVLEELRMNKLNKFIIVTSLKSESE